MPRILAALLAAPLLLLSPAWAQQPSGAEPAQILARGRIEPAGRIHVVAPPARGGTVGELRVAEGQVVAQGEVLAILATHPARAAIAAAAESALAIARLELERSRSGVVEAELDGLAALVAMREAELARAERNLSRSSSLARGNVVSEDVHELRELERRQAREGLRKAQADLRRAREDRLLNARVAEARLAQATAELDRARAERDEEVIRAPIAGTVLNLMARQGETIGAEGLLTLGDLTRLFVMAEVEELQAARLRPGMAARIGARLWPEPLQGRVTRVAAQVFRSERPSTEAMLGRDLRVVEAEIALDPPARLPPILGLEVQVVLRPGGP